MVFTLNAMDFVYATFFSIIFTWIVVNLSKVVKSVMNNPTEFDYDTTDFTKIQKRCHNLFPKTAINFNGEVYSRGMFIKVNTFSNKIFEGIFMGLNSENIICVLTKKHIIAYKLEGIEEIVRIKEDAF